MPLILRQFPILAALVLLLGAPLGAQQAGEWTPLDPIPSRIDVVRDSRGFYWQLTEAGSFFAMGANVFKSAHELRINGENFRAERAWRADDNRFRFENEMDGLVVQRDVWIDTERAGARHVEVVRNTTEQPREVTLTVASDFSFSWQDVYSAEGKLIGEEQSTSSTGILLKFDSLGGQSDFFLLFSGHRAEQSPEVQVSLPARAVLHTVKLTIPAGESRAIASWIGQRSVVDLGTTPEIFEPFLQRRGPVRLNLPDGLPAEALVNFDAGSSPAAAPDPADPRALAALNQLLDEKQIERGAADVLWISAQNQLSGEVDSAAGPLTVRTSWNEVSLPLAELAAWQGGAGIGREHAVYLRDGQVFRGETVIDPVLMKGGDGWEMNLDPESLDTVVFGIRAEDGAAPEGAIGRVRLDSGEWLAVNGGGALNWLLPWGRMTLPLERVVRLETRTEPAPGMQIWMEDGSTISGFPAPGHALELATARMGDLKLDAPRVRTILGKGEYLEEGEPLPVFPEDLEARTQGKEAWVWLTGGNRLRGALPEQKLDFIAGNAATALDSGSVRTIRRTDEGLLDELPLFEVELRSGDFVTGYLRNPVVEIELTNGDRWQVPAVHFQGALTP